MESAEELELELDVQERDVRQAWTKDGGLEALDCEEGSRIWLG